MSLTSAKRGSLGRDADDLGVLAGLVVHVQHADRAALDPHARVHRVLEQDECVERVAVAAEGVGDEAVVGGVGGGGEEATVEEDLAVLVVDLVLVAAPTGDLDDDVDAIGGWWLRHCRPASHTVMRGPGQIPSEQWSSGASTNLPPYVFTIINDLKIEARRAGADVDRPRVRQPRHPVAADRRREAGRGGPEPQQPPLLAQPRPAQAPRGDRRATTSASGTSTLDPELEITNTIGSKEGFSHLMWVLLDRGDAAIVPSPSYPIHIYGPLFAGADLRQVPMRFLADPTQRERLRRRLLRQPARPPTTSAGPSPACSSSRSRTTPPAPCVDLAFMQRVVDFCREHEMIVVHDFAYADVGFDGYQPPSILQAEGAKECAVELYSMTKSFSMAGWRSAFLVGNAEVVQALVKLKSYLDYGMFQPVQIAATVTMNEARRLPRRRSAPSTSRAATR